MYKITRTVISVIAALSVAVFCLAGCSSDGGKWAQEDVNSRSLGDVCRIGNTVYYAPSWSLFGMSAGGTKSETLAHDMGCRMLSEHDGMLYMIAQKSTDDNPVTKTAIMRYDPGKDAFGTVYERVLSDSGDYQNFTEIGTYCVDGGKIYFLVYESVEGEISTFLCEVPADGGEFSAICQLPEGMMPLPYSDIFVYDGLVYVGAYLADNSGDVLLSIDPVSGEAGFGMGWSGTKDDKVFPYDDGIAVCQVRGGVKVYPSPEGGEGSVLLDENDVRCFFVNGKYAVYSRSEVYMEDGDVRYTADSGIYVYDLETRETNRISGKFCEIIGLCGDCVYFYDEDDLRNYTELTDLSQHSFRTKLCRINTDGTGEIML